MLPGWRMLIALLALWAGLAHAAGEKGKAEPAPPSFHVSYSAASEAGAKDGALILLVFRAEGCGPCGMLEQQTLQAPEFLKKGGPLHVVKVDVGASEGLARAFKVNAVPDLLLLSADGKIVARRVGFVPVGELMTWVEEGRRRAAGGVWQGTAPNEKPAPLPGKPSLVEMLGDPDPATRLRVQKTLMDQREEAIPHLMEGASSRDLGVRIGAAEVLDKMLPGMPPMDPWAAPAEREKSVALAQKWWAETGKRLPPPAPRAVDPAVKRSIENALAGVLSDDPVRRTEGMSALVMIGEAALPEVREQIRRCERRNEQKALGPLEDVRWAILVPDAVEASSHGARRDLARGTSQERQAAALRLAQAGKGALPALTELIGDGDSLVKETALHALAKVNVGDVLLPMASLLKASDSNLRMTAAQLLGRTKRKDAAQYLITVLDDPDEVVACTALSALEEIKATNQRDALVRCLSDTRWRVRAAAAETLGKLKIANTANELTALLDDPDSFVVTSALNALKEGGTPPDFEKLRAAVKRLPTLAGLAAEILIGDAASPAASVEQITAIYDEANNEGRATIFDGLTRGEEHRSRSPEDKDDYWKPLLTKALASTDALVRRKAADFLARRSSSLACALVTPILDDNDKDVRAAAAGLVCRIILSCWEEGEVEEQEPGIFARTMSALGLRRQEARSLDGAGRVNELLKRHADWRSLLLKHAGPAPDARVVLAIYATGDGRSDLPLLAKLVDRPDLKAELEGMDYGIRNAAISMMVKRLPPPETEPIVQALLQKPLFYAEVLSEISHGVQGLKDYVSDPDRLVSTMSKAGEKELDMMINALLQGAEGGYVSLAAANERTDAILRKLRESSNPVLRTLGVYGLISREDSQSLELLQRASKDPNPWVRRAALQGIIFRTEDRKQLEEQLKPFLGDSSIEVASTAALGLLDPGISAAAGFDRTPSYFRSGKIHSYSGFWWRLQERKHRGPYQRGGGRSARPLAPLPDRPDFLPRLRELLNAKPSGEDEEDASELLAPFALLLAQYGDPSGLDKLQELRRSGGKESVSQEAILTASALSMSPERLAELREMAGQADEGSLRRALGLLRGMGGPEARALRREINNRLQDGEGRRDEDE